MKFFHLADLHLGKMVHGYSMIEMKDQPYWVERLLEKTDQHQPDAVLISGDVYDRAVPSKEAVKLFDELLTELSKRKVAVIIIAGNHDSGSRLAFADRLLCHQGIYIAGEIGKKIEPIILEDKHGKVYFWPLPYLFPAAVQAVFGKEDIKDYDSAVKAVLEEQKIDFQERNVILSHQFVVSGNNKPTMGGSETTVGGIGQVDASVFERFDYVALGHIHNAQRMGKEQIRYAGSPLCYHFSEAGQKKGLTIVELGRKGEVTVSVEEMKMLHKMKEYKGTLEEILEEEIEANTYVKAIIRQEFIRSGTVEILRNHFESKQCVLMEVVRDFLNTGKKTELETRTDVKSLSLEQLFSEFYKSQYDGEFLGESLEQIVGFVAEQTRNGYEEVSEKERNDDLKHLIKFASEVKDEEESV